MATSSGFFDARQLEGGTYDRDYDAADFAAYFSSLIDNGLIETDDNSGLKVESLPNPSMNVIVKPGRAFINGYWFENDGDVNLSLDTPSDTLDRYDIVVVRLDLINRVCELLVRTGTESSTPVPPTLQRNINYYELQLAQIYVQHGYMIVTDTRITDTRPDEDLCGFVKGVGDGGGVETAYIVGSTQFALSWLARTPSGNPLTPKENTLYLILTEGYYYYHTFTWDNSQNRYMQVSAPVGRLTENEVETMWQNAGIDAYIDNMPVPVYNNFVYDGQVHYQSFLYYDSSMMSMSGAYFGTNAGTYTVIFTPINGYAWADTRTMEARTVSWSIGKVLLPKPYADNVHYAYNGSEIELQVYDYNSSLESSNGTTGTAKGTYEAVFGLLDTVNYAWSDGTISAVSILWYIGVGSPNLTLSSYEVSVGDSSVDVDISHLGTGTLSVSTANIYMADAVLGVDKVTISAGSGVTTGDTIVTVSITATADYSAESKQIIVHKTSGVNIVDWSDGPDQDIVDMIEAADNGYITLSDYWHIGDTRRVLLDEITIGTSTARQPQQYIDLVLMHNPLGNTAYNLVTPTAGHRNQPNFIVGVKNCLENLSLLGAIQDTISLTGTTDESAFTYSKTVNSYVKRAYNNDKCEMFSFLETKFYNALPTYIKSILKTINRRVLKYTDESYSDSWNAMDTVISNMDTEQVKICLPNIREMFNVSYSSLAHYFYAGSGDRIYDISCQPLCSLFNIDASQYTYFYLQKRIEKDFSNIGTLFTYYNNASNKIKKRGISGDNVQYYLSDSARSYGLYCNKQGSESSHYGVKYAACDLLVDENGNYLLQNLQDEGVRDVPKGISPIMFI